eukprot:260556_1
MSHKLQVISTVIRFLHEPCVSSSECADGCACLNRKCENDQTKKNCPARREPIEQMIKDEPLSNLKPQKMQQKSQPNLIQSQATGVEAYEQIYGDDYVQQRGVGGYIPMYDAPYHYEQVQPVYQPQLASSTNPDSMQYGLMLLGLGLFLCLAICIVFVLLSAVCFVVGRFSNA